MSLTVTWQEDTKEPEVWKVDDVSLTALDAYRLTLIGMVQQVEGGPLVRVLRYATVKEMIVGIFIAHLVRPALKLFPPTQIADLVAKKAEADRALAVAKEAIEQSVLTSK